MNAKRTGTIRKAIRASLTTVCLTIMAYVLASAVLFVPATSCAQTSGEKRLSRADVDKLLVEARKAIAEKNLDQADVLIAQAEASGIRYPLLYFGPTPSKVRFELVRAQRDAGIELSTQKPDAKNISTQQKTDPFTLEQPSSLTGADARGRSSNVADSHPQDALSRSSYANGTAPSLSVENPFRMGVSDATSRTESRGAADYPSNGSLQQPPGLTQTQSEMPMSAADSEMSPTSGPEALVAWVPPDAPLPPSRGDYRRSGQTYSVPAAGETGRAVPAADRIPSEVPERYGRYAQPAQHVESLEGGDAGPGITLAPPQTNIRISQLPTPANSVPEEPYPFVDDPLPYANEPSPLIETLPPPDANNDAIVLFEEGEAALEQRDHETALQLFEQAYELREQLDPDSQERLQEHLRTLASDKPDQKPKKLSPSLIESAAADEQVLARQLSAEVGKRQSEARRMREKSPQEAVDLLKETRQKISDSQLSADYREQLLRRLDFSLAEAEQYVEDHAAEIELDTENQTVLEEVERSREVKLKVQQKIADLVDQFNKLRDEQRYGEMEVVARRLYEMAPNDPVAQQVWQNAKFIRRTIMNQDLEDRRETANWMAWNDVEESAVQDVGDGREMKFDQKHWDALVKNRKGSQDRNSRRTERDLEIERRLKTPVLLRYDDAPLSEVVDGLGELAGVNIHLDPRGLSQEGINSDTPVTINLSKEISLKSALNLILEPLHLSYLIKDEVLQITSEQVRDGELVTVTYNVADLVIPIPNFVPSNNIGLQGLMNDAYAVMGYGNGVGMPGPAVLLSDRGKPGAAGGNQNMLAQHFGSSGGATQSMPISSGPGGLGGGANADFDSLIDLIVSTVAADSWAENGGGEAEIREFATNLSLVISQTQAVHEQIADLLEQLRRLQDLQVTIEVRFIRLSDQFFERIGVDFQMNVNNAGARSVDTGVPGPNRFSESVTVGLLQASSASDFPLFTADLNVPFRQGSFNVTTPGLFGFDANTAGKFGFAILSDIEAFFLIEAAQGDNRTNVLNAPKVTLFNGQQAIVTDVVQMPFVIGVIPVVGEFAAAQQPVIVVLNEGTLMSIQAVVSDDRRYVRLTVVPFFTEIGDVSTFTFEGSTSSTSSSSSSASFQDDQTTEESDANDDQTTTTGVTVQLPEFQVITVATTVSVPDGGTVLLGGIKRLREGRQEAGIPLLSKLPYINRLFMNVGIGRDTDSLMMMVTPRIIIQEEEEERLGISAGT